MLTEYLKSFSGKKVLVTGATGFLGGRLVAALHNSGASITALGRRELPPSLKMPGVRFERGSLENESFMASCTEGQDMVVHSAALSAPYGLYRDFYRSNVLGTQNVLRACEKHRVHRCVYISSPSIYFDDKNLKMVTEDMPTASKPLNSYVKTKLESERLVDSFVGRGLDVVTLRPRAIFGPGDTTILPSIIRVNAKGAFPHFDKGPIDMDLTYVDNVVDAILLALGGDARLAGEKFNITNGETYELYDLLPRLFAELGHPHRIKKVPFAPLYLATYLMEKIYLALRIRTEPPMTTTGLMYLAYGQSFDISKAKNMLGYRPRVSVEEGVKRYVAWYRKNS